TRRMMGSLNTYRLLRILGIQKAARRILRRRIRALPFLEVLVVHTRADEQRWQTVIALVAAWLVVNAVLGVRLLGQFLLGRPGGRPHCWIRHRDGVLERLCIQSRDAFDERQVFGGAADWEVRREVRRLYDERVSLEMPARVAEAQAH